MKPAPFSYADPDTLGGVLAALDDDREVAVIAGGQSLVPLLNLRLARPDLVVDPRRVPELRGITVTGTTIRIGAMTTAAEVADHGGLEDLVPGLVEAVRCIGHPPIRNRTTIGGSVAHADPVAELPAALVGLGATVLLASRARGERSVPATAFFTGPFSTERAADELVVAIELAVPAGRTGWIEHARRPGDFAIVGVFASIVAGSGSSVDAADLVVAGLAGVPTRLAAAEAALRGRKLDAAAVDAAAATVADLAPPPSDAHGSGAYRIGLATELVQRLLGRWTQ